MKKFLFFAAAVSMLMACQKESGNATLPENDSKVAIQFGTNLSRAQVATKAPVEEWAEQNLYIYGVESDVADYTAAADKILINNVEATAPGTSGDPSNPTMKGKIELYNPAIPSEPFFYPVDNTTYDFYGYYIGNATAEDPAVAATKISRVVTIDGSQDIMLAMADKKADVEEMGEGKVLPVQAYSAYSARRSVVPNLKFNHVLTRFNFLIKAGAVSGQDVRVKDIYLDSPSAKGELVVVAKTAEEMVFTPNGETAPFRLQNETNTALADSYMFDEIPASTTAPAKEIGESIMLFADNAQYTGKLKMIDPDAVQTGAQEVEFTLDAAKVVTPDGNPIDKFEAGKQYNITILIYGLEEIEITAELVEWGDGGDQTYDPEEWVIDVPFELLDGAGTIYTKFDDGTYTLDESAIGGVVADGTYYSSVARIVISTDPEGKKIVAVTAVKEVLTADEGTKVYVYGAVQNGTPAYPDGGTYTFTSKGYKFDVSAGVISNYTAL